MTHAWTLTIVFIVAEIFLQHANSFHLERSGRSAGRRQHTFLSSTTSSSSSQQPPKILVLGSAGLVGSEIVQQLKTLGIPYKAASRRGNSDNGDEHYFSIDLTSSDAQNQVAQLASDCTAVISTVGSLGTDQDEIVNAASGFAAKGAKEAPFVSKFVFIGNNPRVRSLSKSIPPLQAYAKGKEQAEDMIRDAFGANDGYCIIQPTFIYGGDDGIGLSPPRLPGNIGAPVEDVLGLYPVAAISDALPGVFGIALEAPLSKERVASAAINVALGLCEGQTELSSRDEIILAACKRPSTVNTIIEASSALSTKEDNDMDVEELKQHLFDLGDCSTDPEKLREAFDLLEDIESKRPSSTRPSTDSTLNGRWDFVFDVEPDMGTGVIKDILEGNSPIKPILDFDGVYMEISDEQSRITIHVDAKILGIKTELCLKTLVIPDKSNGEAGTMFMEKFDGITLLDKELPIPESWKRSRPLEISYLDKDIMIARGNGGEPHFLRRG